jgi:RNA polymerase sigma-70 factor (ECF subfamily)
VSTPATAATDVVIEIAFRDHAATIQGTTLRATRDPELADDVTSEAFLRLLTEVRAGRCPDNIRAWLYRTSANLVVSRARREAVARRHSPSLVRWHGPAQPDEIAMHHEAQDELRSALDGLSVRDRTALLMAANGATSEQIARRLGGTAMATRARLARARAVLRAQRDAPVLGVAARFRGPGGAGLRAAAVA